MSRNMKSMNWDGDELTRLDTNSVYLEKAFRRKHGLGAAVQEGYSIAGFLGSK